MASGARSTASPLSLIEPAERIEESRLDVPGVAHVFSVSRRDHQCGAYGTTEASHQEAANVNVQLAQVFALRLKGVPR